MSIYSIPKSIVADIERMMNSFWWGHNRQEVKGINWMSWERLSINKMDGGLGFKNLRAFNNAMLGNQAWKFMTDPNNIVTRLFKAKYFPKCDFLESRCGHNPSYVWRSIWSARNVVKTGYKWSIGSGLNIPFWDQNWVDDGSTVIRPDSLPAELSNITVADVRIPQLGVWNVGVIRNLVSNVDLKRILQTPIFEMVQKDKRIWNLEANGIYSVKGGYRISLQQLLDSNIHRVEGNWDLIWKLQVPPKVKNLLWRICRNCLPTRVRLHDRGVNCPSSCVLCEDGMEDSMHVFFQCYNSKLCWQLTNIWNMIQPLLLPEQQVSSLIFEFLQLADQHAQAVFACTLWSIWKQRNDLLWRNETITRAAVCERGRNLLMSWQNAQICRNSATVQQQHSAIHGWKKPDLGRYKCNVDAAFCKVSNRVGIGICIRDDQGSFVLAKTEWVSPILKVDVGESLGLLFAIRWLKELHINNVVFEPDSKRVVDSFRSNRKDESDFGAIIRECRNSFSSFTNSQVEFIRRQANEVAYNLARAATLLPSFHLFTEMPDCIETIIANEMR